MRREVRPAWLKVWDVALALIAVGVAAFVVNVVLSFHWNPRTVPLEDGEALYYPSSAVWIIAGIGAALVVAGLRLGLDRQYYNWLFVATGAGLLTLGTTFAARERVVLTPEELRVRGWWGLRSHTWRYDDLTAITMVEQVRVGRRKRTVWATIKLESKGGGVEEYRLPRLLHYARQRLLTDARAKGVVVQWTTT